MKKLTLKNVLANVAETHNGALSNASTLSAVLDFFITGPRNLQDGTRVSQAFQNAYKENAEMALRALLWLRDARGGAGARNPFRAAFKALIADGVTRGDYTDALNVLREIPRLGRWDDVLVALETYSPVYDAAIEMIKTALQNSDFLCAKWMPRKGIMAAKIRNGLNLTPKEYRRTITTICRNSFLLEHNMSSNQWGTIPYEQVPSVAFARNRSAMKRHEPLKFSAFLDKVKKGTATINAGAMFPHDVLRGWTPYNNITDAQELQWNSLPDTIAGKDVGICVVDVSGSMCNVNVSGGVTAFQVAIGLGVYVAQRNKGDFHNTVITFSDKPAFVEWKDTDSLSSALKKVANSQWAMSTNLQAVFDLVLSRAVANKIPEDDMPKTITIISDMQFNQAMQDNSATNLEAIRKKYSLAGYEMPKLVFWNVSSLGKDTPALGMDKNVALLSGFSPSVLKMAFNPSITPYDTMIETLADSRYDWSQATPPKAPVKKAATKGKAVAKKATAKKVSAKKKAAPTISKVKKVTSKPKAAKKTASKSTIKKVIL